MLLSFIADFCTVRMEVGLILFKYDFVSFKCLLPSCGPFTDQKLECSVVHMVMAMGFSFSRFFLKLVILILG